jgi:hypothetical protein
VNYNALPEKLYSGILLETQRQVHYTVLVPITNQGSYQKIYSIMTVRLHDISLYSWVMVTSICLLLRATKPPPSSIRLRSYTQMKYRFDIGYKPLNVLCLRFVEDKIRFPITSLVNQCFIASKIQCKRYVVKSEQRIFLCRSFSNGTFNFQ